MTALYSLFTFSTFSCCFMVYYPLSTLGKYPVDYIGKSDYENPEGGFCPVVVRWSWTNAWTKNKDELWWDPASMGIHERPDGTVI